MIAYLEGSLLKKESDRILLLVNQVGYEILVPAFVMETIEPLQLGEHLGLYIYYHQTEHQPKPVLIGFNLEAEREFFQLFITVEAVGPLKAVKALNLPVKEIAKAIESRDAGPLKRLNGIGERTAHKIIATLNGKMGKFALIRDLPEKAPEPSADAADQVVEVLVEQLGHRPAEAREMVSAAFSRRPGIKTPEELFEEVYRGQVSDEQRRV
ncbi:MAG: Holliday junction DNA helicase RuvA [Desulfobacteraceae bacterium]|nr:Holliday junction DNA helicase RuvA [Desulfobacteraceae bacterium]MCF8096036.1 Holliday junction DNA helicase RuvA [Desulfobacteraceae bacterium]